MDATTPDAETPTFAENELRQGMELLFHAYRNFTSRPDAILKNFNFGRAHHRVIYFVGRHPSITVGELLGILQITRQSLSRVLGQLLREGFIEQRPGPRDKRQRLMRLTAKGEELERLLSEDQLRRMARAFSAAGPQAVAGFRKVLTGMIEPGAGPQSGAS